MNSFDIGRELTAIAIGMDKFEAMLAEYQKAKNVTRQRLYIETMERVLGPIKTKMIIDQGVGGDTVPLLPLRTAAAASTAQAAPVAAREASR